MEVRDSWASKYVKEFVLLIMEREERTPVNDLIQLLESYRFYKPEQIEGSNLIA